VILSRVDLLSLPVVLFAYIIPIAALVLAGSDVPKDIAMGIPRIISAITLGTVGWLLAKP
jgi:hypothetical protein